jgi:transposase-like protein
MARAKMRKVHRYSNEFKITAVRLTDLPGTLIQDVAKALDIQLVNTLLQSKAAGAGGCCQMGRKSWN